MKETLQDRTEALRQKINFKELFLLGTQVEIKVNEEELLAASFPLGFVSYYPDLRREVANYRQGFDHFYFKQYDLGTGGNMFQALTIVGSLLIFKTNNQQGAFLQVEGAKPKEKEPALEIIPWCSLPPYYHRILTCNTGGVYAHVYTQDLDGSNWSFHVEKPNEPPFVPKEEKPKMEQKILL